jgi:chromosome segregation ATPase
MKDIEIKSLKRERGELVLENEKLKEMVAELAAQVEASNSKNFSYKKDGGCQSGLHSSDIDEHFKKMSKMEHEISKQNLTLNQLKLENKVLNQEIGELGPQPMPKKRPELPEKFSETLSGHNKTQEIDISNSPDAYYSKYDTSTAITNPYNMDPVNIYKLDLQNFNKDYKYHPNTTDAPEDIKIDNGGRSL